MSSHKNNSENPALIRQVIAHVPCAICRRRFSARDVQVLDHRGKVWAMAVKCRKCGTDAVLFAVVSEPLAHPIRTDLTPGDWDRFRNAAAIDDDDVIRFHEYIQSYDGDFSEILEEPLPDET